MRMLTWEGFFSTLSNRKQEKIFSAYEMQLENSNINKSWENLLKARACALFALKSTCCVFLTLMVN